MSHGGGQEHEEKALELGGQLSCFGVWYLLFIGGVAMLGGVGDMSRFESCRNWANLKQQAGFQKYPLYFRNLYKKKEKESIIIYCLE